MFLYLDRKTRQRKSTKKSRDEGCKLCEEENRLNKY